MAHTAYPMEVYYKNYKGKRTCTPEFCVDHNCTLPPTMTYMSQWFSAFT